MASATEGTPRFLVGSFYKTTTYQFGFYKIDLSSRTILNSFTLENGTGESSAVSASTGLIYALQPINQNTHFIVTIDANSGRTLWRSPPLSLENERQSYPLVAFDDTLSSLIIAKWYRFPWELDIWAVNPRDASKQQICTVSIQDVENGHLPYFFNFNAGTRTITLSYTTLPSGSKEVIALVDLKSGDTTVYHISKGPGSIPGWHCPSYTQLPQQGGSVIGLNLTTSRWLPSAYYLEGKVFNPIGQQPVTFLLVGGCQASVDSTQSLLAVMAFEWDKQESFLATWDLKGNSTYQPIRLQPWDDDRITWSTLVLTQK